MKKLLFCCILISTIFKIKAQEWAWARKPNSSTNSISSSKICRDNSGNMYVLGDNYGDSYFDSDHLHPGTFVLKYNSAGTLLWTKQLNFIRDISSDAVGNLYVVRSTTNYDTINILKFNSGGGSVWSRSFAASESIVGTSIVGDNDGNTYVTGEFIGDSLAFDNYKIREISSIDIRFFIAKLNSSGMTEWLDRGLNDPAGDYYNRGSMLHLDKLGRIYLIVSGRTSPTNGTEFMVKYDPNGNLILSKSTFDATSTVYSYCVDDSMNIIAAFNTGGYHANSSAIAKFDSLMNSKWGRTVYLPPLIPVKLQIGLSADSAGNIFIAGWAGNPTGYDSVYIQNTWVHFIGQGGFAVAKFDPMGNYTWIKTAAKGGGGYNIFSDMCVDKTGTCYLTGNFITDTIMFDYDTLANTHNWRELFVTKLTPDNNTTTGMQEFSSDLKNDFFLYPNPSSGSFMLFCNGIKSQNISVNVINQLGQCVFSKCYSSKQTLYNINLGLQSKGLYFVELSTDDKKEVKKIIVE